MAWKPSGGIEAANIQWAARAGRRQAWSVSGQAINARKAISGRQSMEGRYSVGAAPSSRPALRRLSRRAPRSPCCAATVRDVRRGRRGGGWV